MVAVSPQELFQQEVTISRALFLPLDSASVALSLFLCLAID